MNSTLIFRAHTETGKPRRSRKAASHKRPRKWPPYALAFDCETRTDAKQSLTFGFARLLRNAGNSYSDCRTEIIFFDPEELKPSEIRMLKHFVARNRGEIAKDIHSRDILFLT